MGERLLLVEKVEHLNLHIVHLEDLVAKEEKKSDDAQKIVNLMNAEHTRVETEVENLKLESKEASQKVLKLEAKILDLKQNIKIKNEKLANTSKEFDKTCEGSECLEAIKRKVRCRCS